MMPAMPTLDEMLRRQREQEDAEVADAEAKATAAGKERFDLARLEQLQGVEPGAYAEQARGLRRRYYVVHTKLRTLAEYAELLREPSYE